MLDFYFVPDGKPAVHDPSAAMHAGSLTLEAYRSMDRVAEGQGQSLPFDYFTDQSLSLAQVEQAHRQIARLAGQGEHRGDGNSAFAPLLRILQLAMDKGAGLQSVAD